MGKHFHGIHGPRLQYQHTREVHTRRLKRRWRLVDLLREQVSADRWPSQAGLAGSLGCSQATVSRDLAHLRQLLSEKNSLPLLMMGGWPVLYCLLAGWGFTLTGRPYPACLYPRPGEPTHLLTKVHLPRRERRRRRRETRGARELPVCPPQRPDEWLEALERTLDPKRDQWGGAGR